MKSWKKPEAIGQEFVANDYVSACAIEVSCDFRTGESLHGGGLVIPYEIESYEDYTETVNDKNSSQKTTRYYRGEWKPITQKFINPGG